MTDSHAFCRNCRAPLRGEFCSQCGQRHWPNDLSFTDVAGEAVEEVFSWDSRLWRSLMPLLFRPGFLTAEFIAGRRARYVPPFRLYLIISFILFLVISLLASNAEFIHVQPGGIGSASDITIDAGSGESAIPVAEGTGSPATDGAQAAEEAGASVNTKPQNDRAGQGDVTIAPIVIGESGGEPSVSAEFDLSLSDEDSPQWLQDFDQRLEDNAEAMGGDHGAFVGQLVEYMPQIMFLLLPVFALLLRLCYMFSPFHYLQHLVFSLHYHSFAYVLYLAGALASSWVYADGISVPLSLICMLYLPLALMRAYGSSVFGAVGKALVILLVDAVLLLMAFALITLLALATL